MAVVAKEAAVAARAAVEKAVEKVVAEKAAVEMAQQSRGKTPTEMSRGATNAFCATKRQRRQPSKEDKSEMVRAKAWERSAPSDGAVWSPLRVVCRFFPGPSATQHKTTVVYL